MTTKKMFVELVELLEANSNKKVSTLMPQILELTQAKVNSKTFHKIDDKVVAIYCYYHKQWELVADVPYGAKASTASGFNTMCKEGVSQWTKQQRAAKKERDEVLQAVVDGNLEGSNVESAIKDIEEQRLEKVESTNQGFDTLEEALANL